MFNVIFKFKLSIRYLANPKIDAYFRCTEKYRYFHGLKMQFLLKDNIYFYVPTQTIFGFKYLITKNAPTGCKKKPDTCVITKRYYGQRRVSLFAWLLNRDTR